jgi:hypothetical protein
VDGGKKNMIFHSEDLILRFYAGFIFVMRSYIVLHFMVGMAPKKNALANKLIKHTHIYIHSYVRLDADIICLT